MIEWGKDWWKIVAPCVLTFILTLVVQQVLFSHNDTYLSYKENKDDHLEIVRGIITDIGTAKKDCNVYTDTKFDSILLLLKEVRQNQDQQEGKINAIYSYILNKK